MGSNFMIFSIKPIYFSSYESTFSIYYNFNKYFIHKFILCMKILDSYEYDTITLDQPTIMLVNMYVAIIYHVNVHYK